MCAFDSFAGFCLWAAQGTMDGRQLVSVRVQVQFAATTHRCECWQINLKMPCTSVTVHPLFLCCLLVRDMFGKLHNKTNALRVGARTHNKVFFIPNSN
jgi:hypothetical protein